MAQRCKDVFLMDYERCHFHDVTLVSAMCRQYDMIRSLLFQCHKKDHKTTITKSKRQIDVKSLALKWYHDNDVKSVFHNRL